MSRLIDADALKEKIERTYINGIKLSSVNAVIIKIVNDLISDAPTIDAVEVVRCRECKYWRNTDAEKIPTASIACGNMHPYDFCSYGEGKTDHE